MRFVVAALVLLFAADALAQSQIANNRAMRANGARREGIMVTCCNDDTAGAPCDTAGRTDLCIDGDWTQYIYCGDKSNITFTLKQGPESATATITPTIFNCNPPQVASSTWGTVDPSLVTASEAATFSAPICVNVTTEFGGGAMDASGAPNLTDQLSVSNFSMGYFAAKINCTGGCEDAVLEFSCWGSALQ